MLLCILLYARFITKALRDLGYVENRRAVLKKMLNQGMICHKTYKDEQGQWFVS